MSSEAPLSHAWFGNVRRLTRRKCSKTASHLHTRVSADLPRKISTPTLARNADETAERNRRRLSSAHYVRQCLDLG
jgi:hypothetical protein